jgi:hypothetical protein
MSLALAYPLPKPTVSVLACRELAYRRESFIVSYEGVVYQMNLEPDTLKIFKGMELYNPDSTWQRTDHPWPPKVIDIMCVRFK